MAALPAHWVNGAATEVVSVTDRGLAYGDGVFETLRYFHGEFVLLDAHLQRLTSGAGRLGITFKQELLDSSLMRARQFLAAADCPEALVKLILTRGSNTERGVPAGYGGVPGPSTIILSLLAVSDGLLEVPPVARVAVCETRCASQPQLAGIKHCNRLEQVLAAREVQSRGLDNGIMLGHQGRVVSAINGNIFVVNAGQLRTPILSSSGVDGTVRKLLLEVIAPQLNVVIDIADIEPVDIMEAEELFITNAIVGLQSAQFDGSHYLPTTLADRLRGAYLDYVRETAE
jgi:4-amino-4-deoxychorismate lyase